MEPRDVKEREERGEEEEEEEISASTLRGKPRLLPISAMPAFSYIPPRRQDPKELSYFSRESQVSGSSRGRRGAGPGRGLEAARDAMGAGLQCKGEARGGTTLLGLSGSDGTGFLE